MAKVFETLEKFLGSHSKQPLTVKVSKPNSFLNINDKIFSASMSKDNNLVLGLIKKNEDVIKDNPNFKNYNRNDTFELSSIMSKFMDAFASMPDERRRYFVSEIKKYRDLDNPTGGISGKNRYKFNKSKIDGKFYQTKRR